MNAQDKITQAEVRLSECHRKGLSGLVGMYRHRSLKVSKNAWKRLQQAGKVKVRITRFKGKGRTVSYTWRIK